MMELPRIAWFTPEVANSFWQFLINVLYVVMPLVLIWMAVEYGGLVIQVIRDAFSRMDRDRDDDYDYEDTRD